jgi:hypothetical protein
LEFFIIGIPGIPGIGIFSSLEYREFPVLEFFHHWNTGNFGIGVSHHWNIPILEFLIIRIFIGNDRIVNSK